MERELIYVTDFTKWCEADLTQENLYRYFFLTDMKSAFLVDQYEKLTGIVTLGSFIDHLGEVRAVINRNCLFIERASMEGMFSQAENIYNKYHIKSEIPVTDDKKRIKGYITDTKTNSECKAAHEKKIQNIIGKVSKYKESVYLKKELEAFYYIMAKTAVYAMDCDEFRRFFSVFEDKIKVTFLSGEDYLNVIERMAESNDECTDEKNTSVIFDFGRGVRWALLKQRGITSIYNPDKFMAEFCYLVENQEFTRIVRITETSSYRLIDFVSDMGMTDISFQANSLMTKFFYDYMKQEGVHVLLTETGSVSTMKASCLMNGIRGSSEDYIGFSFCDLIEQQRIINETISGSNIAVYNFSGAVNAKLTKREQKWFGNHGTLDILLENEDFEALEVLYRGDCVDGKAGEYAKRLQYQWPMKRRYENDIIMYADYSSEYINIENGIRRTCNQPEEFAHTIYFIGPCYAFGPFVEDQHTIPSLLAGMLRNDKYPYRIVNLGILNANISEVLLKRLDLRDGDIIINLIYNENVKRIESMFGNVMNPSVDFDAVQNREDMFFDRSVHCNRKGNAVYANSIYARIRPFLETGGILPLKTNQFYDVIKTDYSDLHLYGFWEYVDMLRKKKEKMPSGIKAIGSIVMNCNPFTLGHQYLVEYALYNCDYLFIFIVQEDKSYFSFEDRFAIADINCKKYRNICVIPSGSMVASDVTFPDYFKREVVRDHPATKSDIKITPITDLRIFSSYIAPALGIKKRFVAEEPLDTVTRQYNEYMKKVLPAFGIEVEEIKRKTLLDGETISASKVRKLYQSRKFDAMKEMIPEETFEYLIGKAEQYIDEITLNDN